MKATQSLKPLSFFHCGSVDSFMYSAVIRPFEASRPAGFSTVPSELDTLFRKWSGFQPMSCAFLIAWAANFGIVTLKNTLAPLFLRFTICESIVGIGHLVGLLQHDQLLGGVAEAVLEALEVVLPVVVVLVEDADLRVRDVLQHVLAA